jgi:hypothetical protein
MLERIRAAIRAELASLGVHDLSGFNETILIRNGVYCGRKYRCQGHHVVWFVEENEIKFFGPSGDLLRSSSPERCLAGDRPSESRAA